MRHSGHVFRRWAAHMAPRGLLLPILLAAAGLTLTSPVPVSAAEPGEVTGVRLGRHAGFLRLVFDLTAPPDYAARATGARAFDVTLSGTSLPPEGHAALAADPLAPDLTVRPAAGTAGPTVPAGTTSPKTRARAGRTPPSSTTSAGRSGPWCSRTRTHAG